MLNRGEWKQIRSGRQFYILDPRPEDIDINDIAHSLSLLCRFGGHCSTFYSVAQHSVIVSKMAPASLAFWGLMHDAAEAYIGDIVTPFKPLFGVEAIERKILGAIAAAFGLPPYEQVADAIHEIDRRVLATERRYLMGKSPAPWGNEREPYDIRIVPVDDRFAKNMFLQRFGECRAQS